MLSWNWWLQQCWKQSNNLTILSTMMKTISQSSAQLSTNLGPPRCRSRSRQMFDTFLSCNWWLQQWWKQSNNYNPQQKSAQHNSAQSWDHQGAVAGPDKCSLLFRWHSGPYGHYCKYCPPPLTPSLTRHISNIKNRQKKVFLILFQNCGDPLKYCCAEENSLVYMLQK